MRRPAALAALIASLGLAGGAAAASADDFTVDDPADSPDAAPAPGDSQCQTAGGNCTLRAALMQANSTAEADTIDFDDALGSVTIRPATRLPAIVAPLTIDGENRVMIAPAAALTGPLIEITEGLTSATGSTLRRIALDGDPAGPGSNQGPLVRVDVNSVSIDRVIARNSRDDGIEVDAQRVSITRSPVFAFAPGAQAIALAAGANGGVAAPQNLRVGPRRADGSLPVTGSTTGEGIVELFRGDPETGPQQYAADAETGGSFGFVLGPEPVPGEKVSATYRDPIGNTSTFATATTPGDVVSPRLLGGVASTLSAVRVQPSEPIDPSTIQTDDFALQMAGSDRAVGGVDIAPDGSSFTLFSSTPWLNGEAGLLTIRAPGTVNDIAGNANLQTQTVRVGGAPGDFIAPAVTSLRIAPKSRICITKGPRCPRPGTYVSFVASEDGEAVFTLVRGKRTLGSRRYAVEPGRNRIRFDGRLRGRKLTAGRYKLFVGVEDNVGNIATLQPRYLFSIRSTTRRR